MQIIKGRYNTANVMIDSIDETTREQIQGLLNHPAFADTYIAIMPDCHAGKGAVVGFTMKMNQYIIPNIIGVDIGCGMLMATFPLRHVDLPDLDAAIKKNIPYGFAVNSQINASPETIDEVADVCGRIGIDSEKALKAIGSLGGGNHFIEAGFNRNHHLCLTIHSGSRNFGKCVADFYQQRAKEGLEKYFIRDQYKDLEFLPVDTDDGKNYLQAMSVAQRFASTNRMEMMRRLAKHLRTNPVELVESVHNFIGHDQIIRKGATPAHLGEKIIIPFNMADGIAVCIGKGSARYNHSAPHGAGRIMSRAQAKKTLNLDSFASQMRAAGVYTTTATAETLDEAPGAYKPMEQILDNIAETVDIVELIKPVYNFKAGSD